MAACGREGLLVWNADSGVLMDTVKRDRMDDTLACALTSDAGSVAATFYARLDGAGEAVVYNRRTRVSKTVARPARMPYVAISADAQTLALAWYDGRGVYGGRGVEVLDMSSGNSMQVWKRDGILTPPSLGMNEEGTSLVVMTHLQMNIYKVHENWRETPFESSALFAGYSGSEAARKSPAMSPNGRWLVAPVTSHVFDVWDCFAGQKVATLVGHNTYTSACAITDGGVIATTAANHALRTYRLGSEIVSNRGNQWTMPVMPLPPAEMRQEGGDAPSGTSQASRAEATPASDVLPPVTRNGETAVEATSSEDKCCVICLENAIDAALKPCWHASFCLQCAELLRRMNMKCALCRRRVWGVQRIFF